MAAVPPKQPQTMEPAYRLKLLLQSGLDPMSLEAVRSDLIGADSMGRRFYFSPQGCQTGRLYIEQPADHQAPRGGLGEMGRWSMLCASAAEVQQVARQLQESQHPGEQRLVAKLAGEIIPLMGGVGSGCGTVDDQKQVDYYRRRSH